MTIRTKCRSSVLLKISAVPFKKNYHRSILFSKKVSNVSDGDFGDGARYRDSAQEFVEEFRKFLKSL